MDVFLFLLRAKVRGKASLSTAGSGMRAWFCLPDLFWRDPGLLIHLCIAEVGSTEVGSIEVGIAEVGPAEIGSSEVGLAEVGLTEVGTAQVGATEVGSAQVGFAEIGSPVEYFSEDGSALGGKAEIGIAQVGFAQVWSERGMLFSPRIPDFSSLFQQVKLFLIGHRVFLLRWSSPSSIA